MYQLRSITTVPEPLSADLMTLSFRLLRRLRAWRSRVVRLSRTGDGVTLKRSCSTASKKVSSAASLWEGGGGGGRSMYLWDEMGWDWAEEGSHEKTQEVAYVG